MFSKAYILTYNLIQTIGWSYIFSSIFSIKINQKLINVDKYEFYLKLFQTLALLEILNILLKIVRSPLMTTLMQVSSRLFIVWPILTAFPESKQNFYGLSLILFSWGLVEIIRYSYYFLNYLNCVPYPLLWLRYSAFAILYPTGITGELLLIYSALTVAKKTSRYTSLMPNIFNISFHAPTILWIVFAIYSMGAPVMFSHMLKQRSKYINSNSKKIEKTN